MGLAGVLFTAGAYAPDGRRFPILAEEVLELYAAIHPLTTVRQLRGNGASA
jgi:hypothetical protein